MLKEIYTLIKNELSAITEIKRVDWDLGQYAQEGADYIPITPEIFIAFLDIQWQTLPGNIQKGVLTFDVTQVSETVYADDRDMLDIDNINHLNIEAKSYKALMNKRYLLSDIPEHQALADTDDDRIMIESIVRVGSIPHNTINNLILTTQQFQCTVFDYYANPASRQVLVQLGYDVQIQNPIQ